MQWLLSSDKLSFLPGYFVNMTQSFHPSTGSLCVCNGGCLYHWQWLRGFSRQQELNTGKPNIWDLTAARCDAGDVFLGLNPLCLQKLECGDAVFKKISHFLSALDGALLNEIFSPLNAWRSPAVHEDWGTLRNVVFGRTWKHFKENIKLSPSVGRVMTFRVILGNLIGPKLTTGQRKHCSL